MFLYYRSPSYQLANKNKKIKDQKGAPLADPEPTSDISNQNAALIFPPNNGNITKPEPLGDFIKAKALQSVQSGIDIIYLPIKTKLNFILLFTTDSVSNSPLTLNPPCDLPSATQFLPQSLLTLNGNPTKNRRTEKDKKIVFYILAADDGHKVEKSVLYSLYKELQQHYASRGFEIQISDMHETCDEDFLDPSCWVAGPIEAKGGHHLASKCIAEISSIYFLVL